MYKEFQSKSEQLSHSYNTINNSFRYINISSPPANQCEEMICIDLHHMYSIIKWINGLLIDTLSARKRASGLIAIAPVRSHHLPRTHIIRKTRPIFVKNGLANCLTLDLMHVKLQWAESSECRRWFFYMLRDGRRWGILPQDDNQMCWRSVLQNHLSHLPIHVSWGGLKIYTTHSKKFSSQMPELWLWRLRL